MRLTIALNGEHRKELERLLRVVESLAVDSDERRWVQIFTFEVAGAYIEGERQ